MRSKWVKNWGHQAQSKGPVDHSRKGCIQALPSKRNGWLKLHKWRSSSPVRQMIGLWLCKSVRCLPSIVLLAERVVQWSCAVIDWMVAVRSIRHPPINYIPDSLRQAPVLSSTPILSRGSGPPYSFTFLSPHLLVYSNCKGDATKLKTELHISNKMNNKLHLNRVFLCKDVVSVSRLSISKLGHV